MLKEIRTLFGYTQSQIAEKAGITQNYYTLVETGKYKQPPALSKIANALNLKRNFLIFGNLIEYPFTSDFYIFTINKAHAHYDPRLDFLLKFIIAPAKYVDILILEWTVNVYPGSESCLAVRDDHGTIFLVRRTIQMATVDMSGKKEKLNLYDNIIDLIEYKQSGFYEANNYLYVKIVNIPIGMVPKIKDGTISKEDIITFFPSIDFFKKLYEVRKK